MRMMAWERAKGELKSVLHSYWPTYRPNGSKIDGGYDGVHDKIEKFIQEMEDLIL